MLLQGLYLLVQLSPVILSTSVTSNEELTRNPLSISVATGVLFLGSIVTFLVGCALCRRKKHNLDHSFETQQQTSRDGLFPETSQDTANPPLPRRNQSVYLQDNELQRKPTISAPPEIIQSSTKIQHTSERERSDSTSTARRVDVNNGGKSVAVSLAWFS